MQRLFSSFADGWPGGGLLIQRLLIGAALLHTGLDTGFTCLGATPICVTPICLSSGVQIIGAVGGLFLIFGLWTPVVGFLTAALQAWIALTSSGDHRVSFLLAIFAATLAMIGPGAWSIDARLFGRKYIIPNGSPDFPQKW